MAVIALTRADVPAQKRQTDLGYNDPFTSYDILEKIVINYQQEKLIAHFGTYLDSDAAESDNNHVDITILEFGKADIPAALLSIFVDLREKAYTQLESSPEGIAKGFNNASPVNS